MMMMTTTMVVVVMVVMGRMVSLDIRDFNIFYVP